MYGYLLLWIPDYCSCSKYSNSQIKSLVPLFEVKWNVNKTITCGIHYVIEHTPPEVLEKDGKTVMKKRAGYQS